MVNPSPDVMGRDFNNLMDVEGGGNLTRKINIINSIDSTDNHKCGDEPILHNNPNHNNRHPIHLTYTNSLRVFHQNIRGLKHKTDELLSALCTDFPHVLCLMEHHVNSL